ncbi:aminoglycoside adenylyltransferase domain-containing protein [Arsenicicoccus cauae]|nr:aminoglycoside adenylyltransferase domain-containing protein [Arsenicicoccus cauae]
MTTPWQPLADRVLAALREQLGDDLVGVYVHGSAALGGFVRGRSDLDVLAVVSEGEGEGQPHERDWAAVGAAVSTVGDEWTPLELSVIRRSLAESPHEPWDFAVHVTASDGAQPDSRVVLDRGDGDPDLLLHLAVVRAAGIALHGPAPAELVGAIDRDEVLAQLVDELRWGVDNADEGYAVLNACRALRFAETGELVSKVDGAEWLLEQRPEHEVVVRRALDAQRRGIRLDGATMAGRALVQDVLDDLTWA